MLFRRALEFLASQNRLQLPKEPAPPSWHRVIDRNVPLARRLTLEERERLIKVTQLLLNEVPFEGCDGLAMTDEIRVTIAATACILIVNLRYPRFLKARRVLVYPDTFIPVRPDFERRTIHSEVDPSLGEAWMDGMVVLSWNRILADVANPDDGHNVVLHEFAHVLDHEDGYSDGTPVLDGAEQLAAWGRVLDAEFSRQHDAVANDDDAPLDDYAATNEAEFFAVATEAFFEAPTDLRNRLPELYQQLSLYYRQDPASSA